LPAALDVRFTTVGEPPFFTYRTWYAVLEDKPVSVIDPVDDPHAVGLVPELPDMAGTAPTLTTMVARLLSQPVASFF
jgi:hypothetical protein